MGVALFVSPHLDDVAFSCGGTLSLLLRRGWAAHLCTVFTASVSAPRGFALRCQTDKGLAPGVAYMDLRRAEDFDFARVVGGAEVVHMDFREAPHRGYESAAELFGGVREADDVWRGVAGALRNLDQRLRPHVVFAPQGLGGHVDHEQTIRAVVSAGLAPRALWYRDTPYAIRQPSAQPSALLPEGLRERAVGIDEDFERKAEGCRAYRTQLGFQFGGGELVRETLRDFHAREAARTGVSGGANEIELAEALLVPRGVALPGMPGLMESV